jgi:hypothetical protein
LGIGGTRELLLTVAEYLTWWLEGMAQRSVRHGTYVRYEQSIRLGWHRRDVVLPFYCHNATTKHIRLPLTWLACNNRPDPK